MLAEESEATEDQIIKIKKVATEDQIIEIRKRLLRLQDAVKDQLSSSLDGLGSGSVGRGRRRPRRD